MYRRTFSWSALALLTGLLTVPSLNAQNAEATPENAAAFLGDWTVTTGEGLSIAINIKVEEGKLVANISGNPFPTGKASGLTKYEKGLAVFYSIDYNGNPVPVTISLEPDGEKTWAYIDFANGAYKMNGEAAKKKTP